MIKCTDFNRAASCPPYLFLSILFAFVLIATDAQSNALDGYSENDVDREKEVYTFSWNLTDRPDQLPRGGLTSGTPVKLDRKPSPRW